MGKKDHLGKDIHVVGTMVGIQTSVTRSTTVALVITALGTICCCSHFMLSGIASLQERINVPANQMG